MSTTAIRRSPPLFLNEAIWIAMYPRKKIGTRKVPIQNAFVRTRSRYSRRMTAKIFFQLMVSSLDRTGFFDTRRSDCIEIDLLELRLLGGKAAQRMAVHRVAQELALVGPRRERDDISAVHRL